MLKMLYIYKNQTKNSSGMVPCVAYYNFKIQNYTNKRPIGLVIPHRFHNFYINKEQPIELEYKQTYMGMGMNAADNVVWQSNLLQHKTVSRTRSTDFISMCNGDIHRVL